MLVIGKHTTVTCSERATPIGKLWFDALAGIVVRHPNGTSRVELTISSDDVLKIALDKTLDTRDLATPMRSPFVIACVKLACWPGAAAARAWLAAGWSGYVQHEALELVTYAERAVLDPHAEPYETAPANRPLRDGFPPQLTIDSLKQAMTVVIR